MSPSVKLNNQQLTQAEAAKYLGIQPDQNNLALNTTKKIKTDFLNNPLIQILRFSKSFGQKESLLTQLGL